MMRKQYISQRPVKRIESIKEKAEEYAKTWHTDKNLLEIVSWDFEVGANYVLDVIAEVINQPMNDYLVLEELKKVILQLKK